MPSTDEATLGPIAFLPMPVVRFHVEGHDCPEEVLLLRRALEGRPGVETLAFNVVQATMDVSLDTARFPPEAVITAVAETGLAARVARSAASARPAQSALRRDAWTFLSGALLVAGLIVQIAGSGSLWDAVASPDAGARPHASWGARFLLLASIACALRDAAPRAWGALRRLQPDMNLLMTVAIAGAVALGDWLEAATVAFNFSLSLFLERRSMDRTRRAVESLLGSTPRTARVVDRDEEVREVSVIDVPVGGRFFVPPHEQIPLDGLVLAGTSDVNEAAITGESLPAPRSPGDSVYAGTLNGDGALEIESTRPAADTTLARIVHLVQESHSRRAPSEQWVETFARWYTPAMFALAIAVAIIPPLAGGTWSDWAYRGLVVLVVACPCALVISTPVSIVSALAAAARQGVLVKGGRSLEAAARLRAMAFDKTGTLTTGRPAVQSVVACNDHTGPQLLERAAALESHSAHPIAAAVLHRARSEGISAAPAADHRILPGLGVEGVYDGRLFWAGSHRLMHDRGGETDAIHERAVALEDAGHTVVAVGNDRHVCGLISVADAVRPVARAVVAELRTLGFGRLVILTGDNETTARAIAEATGIDEYRAGLLPEEKVRAVEALRRDHGTVAMVGDGVNDAPAMAAATVGIAMGAIGSDAAIETADVALMADDLTRVPWLVRHARRARRIIVQNIAFALGLKLAFVVLTLLGAASMWAAIAADTGATLLVIANGLRLLQAEPRARTSSQPPTERPDPTMETA